MAALERGDSPSRLSSMCLCVGLVNRGQAGSAVPPWRLTHPCQSGLILKPFESLEKSHAAYFEFVLFRVIPDEWQRIHRRHF
jgi:hypothetical protein